MSLSNKAAGIGAARWSDLNAAKMEALCPGDDPRPGFSTVWPNILWVAAQFLAGTGSHR